MFVLILMIVLAIIIYFSFIKDALDKNKRPVMDDNIFQQNGVRVDYKAGTITFNNKWSYNVNQITGIKSFIEGGFNNHVQIEVDDLKKPVHRIRAFDPSKFAAQISIAVRKAGDPSFV